MADDATFEFEPEQRAAGEKPAETSTVPRSPRHQAARDLAAAGIPVFPCVVGGKAPAVERGFRSASVDPAQIDTWWAQADYNVAFSPEDVGLCVVDVEADGAETWAALELEHGIVPTHEVTTPRGGVHYYYRGSLPASVQKLGDKVDTRGCGSYVLCPPSVVGGNAYEVAKARAYAPVPNWIVAALWRQREALPALGVEEDRPENISRARAYLAGRGAEEGSRNDTAFRHAATLRDLGLSQQATLDMLSKDWECEPPLDPEELERTAASAYRPRDGQNAAGAYAVQSSQEMFGAAVNRQNEIGSYAPGGTNAFAEQVPKLTGDNDDFHPWTPAELARLPPPEWLIDGEIERHGRAMIYGPTNTGKTFAVLNYLLPLTLKGYDIVYVAGEDHIGQIFRRANAWAQVNGSEAVAAFQRHFRVVANMPLANVERAGEFCASMRGHGVKPSVVILDTLSTALAGRKENDASDLADFWDVCQVIERGLDTSLFLVHHTGKDVDLGPRGSSNIAAGLTTMFELKADETAGLISLRVCKQRNAPKPEVPLVFRAKELSGSLVLTRLNDEERREAVKSCGASPGVTPDECATALHRLGAGIDGAPVTTPILAAEVAMMRTEAGRPDNHEGNIGRSLRQRSKSCLQSFVMHPADRRGDTTTWQDRRPETASK